MTAPDADIALAAVPEKRRRKLDRWLMETLGRDWCSNDGPPLDNRSVYVLDDHVTRVFATTNDGFEVGIGYPNEWQVIMRRTAARKFAWWMFKVEAANWFGLRTWLWYRGLHHACKGEWKWRPYPRNRNLTRWSSYDEWLNSAEGRAAQSDGLEGGNAD